MEDESSLGEVLREARVQKGLSLRTVAAELGITPSYQSDIENDRRVPAEEVLARTAILLDLDFDRLMARAGRFGERAERYLKRQPAAVQLFRRISEKNLSRDELEKLGEQVERIRKEPE